MSGYRKLSDGTWEQPAQAEKRILGRAFRNCVASGLIMAASALSAVGGAALIATSGTMDTEEQTDYDKVLGGIAGLFGAFVLGAGGAAVMSARHERDTRSLESVRFDKQRGATIINGRAVDPEHLREPA